MPGVEVFAVEVKRFRGEGAQTLVPRVFGSARATRSAVGSQPRLNRESFLADFAGDAERDAAARLLDAAAGAGAALAWGPSGVNVRIECAPLHPQPVTVAWLWAPSKSEAGMVWMKTRAFSFGTSILDYDPDERLRPVLERWVDEFERAPFTDASSRGVQARSIDYAAAVGEVEWLQARLGSVMSEIRALAGS